MAAHAAERELLCAALFGAAAARAPLDRLAARVSDWRFVVERARANAVLPLLARAMANEPVAAPAWVRQSLDEELARNAAQNAQTLADLAAATKVLHAAGILSLVMKGAALMLTQPVCAVARHVDDIDLCVAPEDHDRASAALAAAGFRRSTTFTHDGRDVTAGFFTAAMPHSNPFVGPAGTVIELHVADPGARRPRPFGERHARGRTVERAGLRFRVPSDEDLLQQICDHVVVHHAAAPRYLARHLADVQLLAGAGATSPSVRVSLALGGFARRRPAWAGRILFASRRVSELYKQLHADALYGLETAQKPAAMWQRLFPTPAFLATRYRLPTPRGFALARLYARRIAGAPFRFLSR